MKKLLTSESGAASLIEAIIIFPIVFLCVVFLIFSGFTFVQRAVLQSTADRISQYISKCIAYPGYGEIIDPFYGVPPGQTLDKGRTLDDRIAAAMKESDPYRYVAGFFGLNSDTKDVPAAAEAALLDGKYLESISFLQPDGATPLIAGMDPESGYICVISADTSNVTVYLGQYYIFADFFRMIGMNGKKQILSGKSTSNVADVPEMIRLVDFSFDTVEDIILAVGGDKGAALIEKIKNAMQTISGPVE